MVTQVIRNSRGQGLIEYVILVALVGAATIGMVRTLQEQVKVNLANVVHTLQGSSARVTNASVPGTALMKTDFSNFMGDAAGASAPANQGARSNAQPASNSAFGRLFR